MANDINIRIGAKLDGLQRGIKKAQGQLSRFANFAETTGRDLTTRLSLPIIGVGAAAVTSFAKFERMQLGLKAIADEGEDVNATLSRLQEIAKLPGISLEQAVDGASQLRTVGFEARQAEEILRGLSQAVTLSGKGPAELQSVVKQLTQMSAKGRILQEDLGVIQENVPSVGIAIQDAFGTNNIEAIRKSGVSAQEFTAEIIKAIASNEKFQKAQGGLANEFDNFGQSVTLSLAALGQTIAESINLSGILQGLSNAVAGLTAWFQNLSVTTQKFIVIGAAVAAAIGPIFLGIGALTKVFLGLQAAFLFVLPAIQGIGAALALLATPVGAVVVALGLFSAAIVVAYKGSSEFRAIIAGVGETIKTFAINAVKFLSLPVRVLGDLLKGDLESAQSKVKEVLGVLSGENAGVAFAEAYNRSIAKSLAKQTSEIAKRQTGSRGRLGGGTQADLRESDPSTAPDKLNDIFANIPKTPTIPPIKIEADSSALEEVVINYNRVGVTAQAASLLTNGLTRDLQSLNGIAQVSGVSVGTFSSFINGYGAEIEQATIKSEVFGESFNLLGEKINITKAALGEALEQFGANSEQVAILKENLVGLNAEYAILNEEQALQAEKMAAYSDAINTFGSSIASMAESGAASLRKFAQAALSAIADVIGALIKQGVAAAISGSLTSAPGPIGLALAGAAGAIASGILKGAINKITAPKLKDGGIIPPGYSGDKFPAFLNSGEAVIPIDRLMDAVASGGGSGQFILRGADLVTAYDRASYNRVRVTGN